LFPRSKKLIKYVLLDIQPRDTFKEYDVSSLLILQGVLRIVLVGNDEDTESINTNQFFLSLVHNNKDRDGCKIDHDTYNGN
jgi:hypothetical protein